MENDVVIVLQLVGIAVELAAGFILSVEAIGVDRVGAWASGMYRFWDHVEKVPWYIGVPTLLLMSGALTAVFGFSTGIAGTVLQLLIGWIVVGLGVTFAYGLVVFALAWSVETTKATRAGVIGFVLLTAGFGLQFVALTLQLIFK